MGAAQHDPAATGSTDELSEIAVEQLGLCAFHARLGADQGAVSADAGMVYNARRAVAHLRLVTEVLTMLTERNTRERAEAVARRGADALTGAERRGEAASGRSL